MISLYSGKSTLVIFQHPGGSANAVPSVATRICCSEEPETTEREVNGCLVNNEEFQLLCLDPAVLHLGFFIYGTGVDAVAVGNEWACLTLKGLAKYAAFDQN